jgi:hypothetical protein
VGFLGVVNTCHSTEIQLGVGPLRAVDTCHSTEILFCEHAGEMSGKKVLSVVWTALVIFAGVLGCQKSK